MRSCLALLGLVVACSTSPNPRSCKDGTCTDPAFPFCDVDGALEGTAGTCLAVECMPSMFQACRADSALTCNAAGNDYDIVACPKGCGDSGCKACTVNTDCSGASPICGASGQCRACALDSECDSQVCEMGSCVAESGILYASSGASDAAPCTRASPCSATRAFSLARSAAVVPIVRLLPEVFSDAFVFDGTTASPIRIVATGATLVTTTVLEVQNGARVQLRGGSITATTAGIECGISTGPKSTLAAQDVMLSAAGLAANLANIGNCKLTLEHCSLDVKASNGNVVSLTTNGELVANRIHVTATALATLGGFGTSIVVTVTNSLLENATVLFFTQDSASPGSVIRFGSNTIVMPSDDLDCTARNFRTQYFDNNIIFSRSTVNVANSAGCTLSHNLLYPQAAAQVNNIIAAPQFVNDATADYHLMATSPAIDAAMATGNFPTFSADLDGVSRPQGAKPDIGAYERKP